jgi:hypothetical protein
MRPANAKGGVTTAARISATRSRSPEWRRAGIVILLRLRRLSATVLRAGAASRMTRIISRFSFLSKSLRIAACASLALTACQSIAPVPGPKEKFLLSHYVLAHEDGFALDKEKPGRITHRKLSPEDARRDIELNIFTKGIDAYLDASRQEELVYVEPTQKGPLPGDIELNIFTKGIDAYFREDFELNIFTKGIDAYLDAYVRQHEPKPKNPLQIPKPKNPLQILVFVHGGLNGYTDDFLRMRRMLVTTRDCKGQSVPSELFVTSTCPHAKTSYYPIFVNWNSALGDSIVDDLFFLRGGERKQYKALATSPLLFASRVVASVLNPLPAWDELKRDLTTYDWGFWLLPVRVLMTPAVVSFGTPAWQIMYRRADLLASPVLQAEGDRVTFEGAAWSLLEALSKQIARSHGVSYWTAGNYRIPVEITLVGHSMGAIVINRLLTLMAQRPDPLPITNIIYLAPAASLLETEMSVVPFLRANTGARLWVFALAKDDETHELYGLSTERSFFDGLFRPVLPRGTLLTWIDTFFEPVTERGDYRVGSGDAFKDYVLRFGKNVFTEDVEVVSRKDVEVTRKQFNYCEWDANSPQRPTTHGQAGDPTHLEAVLSGVSPSVFDSGVARPKVPAKCASYSIFEWMRGMKVKQETDE